MEIPKQFEKEMEPFYWVDLDAGASVCLTTGGEEYLQEIFDTRADDGFIGNGYDWASLAYAFLKERCPELEETITFDPEADMFCANSTDADALLRFILLFKKPAKIKPLFRICLVGPNGMNMAEGSETLSAGRLSTMDGCPFSVPEGNALL